MSPAFDLGQILAQALCGLIECGFHSGEFVASVLRETCAEVSLGHAAGKRDDALEPRGYATGSPRSEGQRNSQRDQAGPQCLATKTRQRIVRSSLDQAAEDEFHRRCLENKQEHEQTRTAL